MVGNDRSLRRVVVTGMGVVSPSGNDIATFWNNITAGKCAIVPLEGFEDTPLPVHVAGVVKDFSPLDFGMTAKEVKRSDRFSQMAEAAATQALASSGIVAGETVAPERFGVYVASGIGGLNTQIRQTKLMMEEGAAWISPMYIPMVISNIAGGNIAMKYNAQGPCITHVSACASSTNSIGEAYTAIQSGRADAILAGGSESVINVMAIAGFANIKALSPETDPMKASLPFDSRRKGFVMAEGAGMLMMEEYGHAKARGANIIAEIVGYGCTCDAYHLTAPRPDGTAAARAMKAALDEGGYEAGENLYVNAHGTGTHYNDLAETKALKLALGEEEAHRASISSSKSMTGHMLGATGAVEAIVSVLALRDGIVPPTAGLEDPDPGCDLDYTPLKAVKRNLDIALSNSLGFGGHNVCVTFRKIGSR
ncbi:MAG: beta-ketoacyl-ACP synthase II [Bacteroidales bacterium]|nr:beta-ketoacyl-ACP synthase II [Bacteroidales bacterium]